MKPKLTQQKKESGFISGEVKRLFAIMSMALLLSFTQNANAQAPDWAWVKGIGGAKDEAANDIALDAYGNIYTVGLFSGKVDFDPGSGIYNLTSSGSYDIFITKSDCSGNLIWAKSMGGTGDDRGEKVDIDNSGNIYISGSVQSTTDFDPGIGVFNLAVTNSRLWYIAKYDNDGNFIWVKAHNVGNDEYEWMTTDATGSVYSVGHFWGVTIDFDPGPATYNLSPVGAQDIFIYKLNNSGDFEWAYRFGGGSTDLGWGVAIDASNNVYACGSFSGTVDFDPGSGVFNLISKGGEDVFVLKLSSAGNLIWAKGMGGGYTERPEDISIDPFGNIVTSGFFMGTADFDPGIGIYNLISTTSWDCFISKLDSLGNFVWAKSNEAGVWFERYFSDFDAAGNVYTFGAFTGTVDLNPGIGKFKVTSKGGMDCFIMKLDSYGNFIWGKAIGGPGDDFGLSLVCNDAGQLFIALIGTGSVSFDTITLASKGSWDFYIGKLNQDNIVTPCNTSNCNISPGVFATNVLNTDCDNGTIKVKCGNGVYNFYPHIELYKDASLVTSIDLCPGSAEYTFTNLIPGKYTVKVSDGLCCQITFIRNIKCRAPSSGFQASNITTTSAQLTWNVANCAEGYRVLYRPQGATTWLNKGVSTNTGLINLTGLMRQTTYEWRVGTKCNGWPEIMNILAYSPISTFTTSALRVGEVITQSNATSETFEINVFPNPATYTLTVNFEGESETANLKVVNILGEAVMQKQIKAVEGIFETQLDIANLKSGMYMLKVETENGESRKVFVKE